MTAGDPTSFAEPPMGNFGRFGPYNVPLPQFSLNDAATQYLAKKNAEQEMNARRVMQGMTHPPVSSEMSPVEKAAVSLSERITDTMDAIETLEKRLAPVLSRSATVSGTATPSDPPPLLCPMASLLTEQGERVKHLTQMLGHIISTLEI